MVNKAINRYLSMIFYESKKRENSQVSNMWMRSLFVVRFLLFLVSYHCFIKRLQPFRLKSLYSNENPSTYNDKLKRNYNTAAETLKRIGGLFTSFSLIKSTKANAIGSLYELNNQQCVLQDISFNVIEGIVEHDAMSALCLNTLKITKQYTENGIQSIISSFGPIDYRSPPSFRPGVSSFFEDGGHASITYK